MISPSLQAWSRRAIERVVRPLARTGIDPNALTIAGLLISIVTAVVIGAGWLVPGGILVLLTGGFDTVDGAVARLNDSRSTFGAFLDSTLDRWAEGAIFTGLIWHLMSRDAQLEVVLAITALIGSVLVSYTRARAEGLGIACNVGFFQRPERLIVLGVSLLGPFALLTATLAFLALVTQLTAVQRVLHVYREIERAKQT